MLLRHRRYLPQFLMWGMVVAVPFIAFNYSVYARPLSPYYLPTMLRGLNPDALVGNLISPSRGLFVFSSGADIYRPGHRLETQSQEI